jgi:hypothetical protein
VKTDAVMTCRACGAPVVVGELPARVVGGRREAVFLLLDAMPTACASGFVLVDATGPRFVPVDTASGEVYRAHWPSCTYVVTRGEGGWVRRHPFGFDVPRQDAPDSCPASHGPDVGEAPLAQA